MNRLNLRPEYQNGRQIGGKRIELMQGDITEQQTDAIVNAPIRI